MKVVYLLTLIVCLNVKAYCELFQEHNQFFEEIQDMIDKIDFSITNQVTEEDMNELKGYLTIAREKLSDIKAIEQSKKKHSIPENLIAEYNKYLKLLQEKRKIINAKNNSEQDFTMPSLLSYKEVFDCNLNCQQKNKTIAERKKQQADLVEIKTEQITDKTMSAENPKAALLLDTE